MLEGIFLLLALSVVMAVSSFFAGALPLSMSLSSSQLRTVSSLGMGVLVGTSLIVIIPEGIESVYSARPVKLESNLKRSFPGVGPLEYKWTVYHKLMETRNTLLYQQHSDLEDTGISLTVERDSNSEWQTPDSIEIDERNYQDTSSFYIGLSLVSGFILMFLIDKLSKRASESIQSTPPTRHISLSNLALDSPSDIAPESESFLHFLTPTPKQTRSLTITIGLLIHAVANGVAIGASISSSNVRLGSIIFVAILLHKIPAAFGLTSVLLKQGLSKRAARGHLIIFSLASPAGAVTAWTFIILLTGRNTGGDRGRWWAGMLLLLSAGTFLYVSMHALYEENMSNYGHSSSNSLPEFGVSSIPRKSSKSQMRDTMVTIGGMLIPLITQLNHHH